MEKTVNIPALYGCRVFNEDVMRQTLPEDVYLSLVNTIEGRTELDPGIADVVAAAMKDWAIGQGATHYTHWFQPLTGVTAEKHDSFVTPTGRGHAIMEFSGKELIRGEPDASSFPSGGLRATFEARGYTSWDPASYAFIKDGSLCIPTVFCSYLGHALDAKTPLLRSMAAIDREGIRILRLFGDTESRRVTATVGAEQEYFLVDAEDFKARRDLYYCGRTLFGAPAVKGQELEDHYFGALRPRVSAYMKALDMALWELGISAKTKHNETAPAQHELASVYTSANIAVDQNLLMMEYMKKLAPEFGMECLLAEKPFDGINGSGKHNNWSLSTDTGKNLLKPGKKPAENKLFLLMLAAVIRAVDTYQDLLRISCASAGNDRRLGGDEAPPAIMSVFLGDELEAILHCLADGVPYETHAARYMSFGVKNLPSIKQDNTDRNRTSPFAFTGNKFEFRMVGSSQNIAFANIVLNTAVAESLAEFADVLEGAKSADFADVLEETENFEHTLDKLIADTVRKHRRILFSGNSYSPAWEKEAAARGLCCFKSAPEAFAHFTDEKNVTLFRRFDVMSNEEMISRRAIFFENYRKVVAIEARTMLEMTRRDILPAVSRYIGELSDTVRHLPQGVPADAQCALIERLSAHLQDTWHAAEALDAAVAELRQKREMGDEVRAFFAKEHLLPAMAALRASVDAMEVLTDRTAWPMPTYGDLTYRV